MQPGSRIAHFEIHGLVGAGGMGEVYRARDTRLGRDVAIKVLPGEFAGDPERLRRFEQEARAVATLNHPNILAIHDVGTHEGAPFIVTELLEGEPLRERLSSGALSVRKAVEIGVQIAQGLAAAHEKGIVHRDLKPGNVFLTKVGHVKILDFGIAKLATPRGAEAGKATTVIEATGAGTVLGTLGYMSPEQVRGQEVDHRSDIFSFGVVLYEMVTARQPFARGTAAETASAILTEDPAPLSGTNRALSPALQEIVNRCLEKKPEERFSSAHDLALALRAISGGSEAATVRVSVHRAPRWRWITAGAVLAALVAAALVGVRVLRHGPPTPGAAGTTPSIAVLPFTNLSGDKEQEYFSDGLSEEMMGLLTKVKELHVAGRTSSFAFKGKGAKLADIGQQLHVATVLEGSVRRSGDRLRVSAELVNVADGYQLWAETYDRTMSDIFAMQDDIAGAVVAALKVKLLAQERPATSQHQTKNLEAYAEYLLGRHFYNAMNPESWQRAVETYESAIKLDPGYAAAYAGLAVAETDLAGFAATYAQTTEWEQKAREAAEKVIVLDSTLADGYWARGHLRRSRFPPDWMGAQTDLERAVVLDPGNVSARVDLSYLLAQSGRLSEAIAGVRKAVDLDPLSGTAWQNLGWQLFANGDLPGGRGALGRAIEISPEDALSHYFLGVDLILEGNPKAALLEFGRTLDQLRLQGVAVAEHDLGHASESQKALDEGIARYADNWAYQIAEVYAWRGEKDKAFEWLDRAWAQHDWGLLNLKVDVFFRKLRSDPRYDALLRRMNFPETTNP